MKKCQKTPQNLFAIFVILNAAKKASSLTIY
jgi:hypothetical protein